MKGKRAKYLTAKNIACIAQIKHGFFTRIGGASKGIYSSLNCGYGSLDEACNVTKNRQLLLSELAIPDQTICTVNQIHGNKVAYVGETTSFDSLQKADALVTDKKNIIGILTADCGPVLFADSKKNIVAAAHAGWKGAAAGIIENTVDAMVKLGAKKQDIKAALGPTIILASYEVGEDFYANMITNNQADDRFFKITRQGKYFFNLPFFITEKLTNCGVENFVNIAMDTYNNPELFFSYRRSCHNNENDYGRMLSVIGFSS